MKLTLTTEEARLLIHHLTQQLDHMEAELVHTDKRELQRDLAHEVQALRTLTDRVRAQTAGEGDAGLPEIV